MRAPVLRLHRDELVVDNFAGGGGASLGIEWALGRSPDIAINHNAEALAIHAANHPGTLHLQEDVWDVDPRESCAGRPVGLAWFSPDCTFHSKARGGKPHRDRNKARRRRGLAWVVIRWAKAVKPRVICLENVEELQKWGPLLDDGTPCPARAGMTFRRWIKSLENCGYVVEWRELRACDYGAPTTRKRLFVIARSDGQPIVWPEATHGPGRQPFRTAAECITWETPCPSIFERTRPLADNTLRRIARGIRRYVLDAAEPFIVGVGGRQGQSPERPVSRPYQTITGKADSAIVAPLLARIGQTGGGGAYTNDVRDPVTTVTTKAEHLLVAPTLIQTGYGEREGQAPRSLDLQRPLGTVVGGGQKHALVSAFLAKHYGGPNGNQATGSQLGLPIGTVTGVDHHALVEARMHRGDCEDPLPGWDDDQGVPPSGRDHRAEVRAFLIAYYGTEQGGQLSMPLATVTTHDRFGLVTVDGVEHVIADVGMRMLGPRELGRAQGFPDSYRLDIEHDGKPLSKAAQVAMIGNSVCPDLAEAIVRANVGAVERMERSA